MTTPKDNTEVVRILRDVKDSIWKSITPMKEMDCNFKEYFPSFSSASTSSSSKFMPNIATRLNFSNNDDSFVQTDSVFARSFRTPDALKRKLKLTEAELQTSQAKLKEKESMISVMEPANKKICISLENKLEQCKRQNKMDSQKIEDLQGKLKWAQAETTHAKSKILEVERQKKIEIEKLELKMLAMQQECSNMKTEVAEIKSEKAETVRKLNIDVGRLELKVNMLLEDNEKNQDYIQTLKRQKNELAEKAAMSSALEKELNCALDTIKTLENKIEAEKDAALIVASCKSDLKMLDELKKENKVLKEEISKYRDNNIVLYQEKLRSYQEKLMHAEKKSVAFAKIQVENERLKEKLSQWEGLLEEKSSSFKSPTAFSIRLAQYQKNEVALTNKISQLSNHCITLEKQKNELEDTVQSLNKQLQQFQLNSPDIDSRMKRLQRRVMFLTKERDNYQKLLDSYLNECTMPGIAAHAEHISNLEGLNLRYKCALEKTEKEVDALNEKIKVLIEGNKTDLLLDKVKMLQV